MPLSEPAERELLHLRQIAIRGYERSDGLFDIEAQLSDTKTYSFHNEDRGQIEAGENLHGMKLRMTIDVEMLIHQCEAVTEQGPFSICPDGAASFSRLAGLTIKPGFLKAANERVGGVVGCTHLREMLQQVATVAFQTLYPVRARREEEARRLAEAGGLGSAAVRPGKPRLIDTCFAYRSDGPVVARRWPEMYTGAAVAAIDQQPGPEDAVEAAETIANAVST